MARKVKITRTSMFRPMSVFAVILGAAVIIMDFTLLFVFYLQVRDEYFHFQDVKACPSDDAVICCSAVSQCNHANASQCVDEKSWSGNCCVRTDDIGFFSVVAVLFFLIFAVQLLDLISKIILCRRPSDHCFVKLWEVVLALTALGIAVGLVVISSVTNGASTPDCYDDPETQRALRTTVNGYVDLFQLSMVEVTFASMLTIVDMILVFGIVRPNMEKERERIATRKKSKAAKKKVGQVEPMQTNDIAEERADDAGHASGSSSAHAARGNGDRSDADDAGDDSDWDSKPDTQETRLEVDDVSPLDEGDLQEEVIDGFGSDRS